ncbi:MAG: hypothetical protein ICV74_10435 [Thermoleophilia bacterium]|nr:hypothetical protein [Thermoleophilia bacterium]
MRRLAVPLQAIVWLLFLPVMCGLFVWHRPWPPFLRATAVLAIAAWNVFLFFPRF